MRTESRHAVEPPQVRFCSSAVTPIVAASAPLVNGYFIPRTCRFLVIALIRDRDVSKIAIWR
jgi:hypothetical protein